MIIDGHSHACGEYLTSDSLVATIDKWGIVDILHHLKEMDSFDFNKPWAILPLGFLQVPAADH